MNQLDQCVTTVKEEIGEELFAKLFSLYKSGHISMAELMRIPEEELDNLHQLGRQAIVRKNFSQAEKILKMLVQAYPYKGAYWVTYGICLQNLNNFVMARSAYTVALEFDNSLIEAYVYAAECDLRMQTPLYALEILKPVFHLKVKTPKEIELVQRAARLKAVAEKMESGIDDKDSIDAQMAEDESNEMANA